MRFLITAGRAGDAAAQPPEVSMDLLTAHMRFNEQMHKAGVLVAAEGLNPAGSRARVVASGGKRVVVDGPFAETKELVGGLYLIDVASKEEAIAWALRCPVGMGIDDVMEFLQLTGEGGLPEAIDDVIAAEAPTRSQAFLKSRRR